MEEKSLKIVFLKIHTFDKNLGKESIQRFEEKKEEIESQYALELASIEEQKEYKSIVSKKAKETSDIILDELEKAREKIFVKLVKQINNKREKGLQELEKVVYGNQEPEIVEEYGKRYSEGFVIRCIYYVEKEELEQELKKLVSQLATIKISKVSYHRYLQLKVVRLKDSDTFLLLKL